MTILFGLLKWLGVALKDHWRVILAVLLCWYCWHVYDAQKVRADTAEAALSSYMTKVKDAEVAQRFKNLATQKASDDNTLKTAIAYSDSQKRLKDYYEKNPNTVTRTVGFGVRFTPDCGAMQTGTEGEASGQLDERTEGGGAGAGGVTPLDCAEDVLTLLTLQKWEREQAVIYAAPVD